MKILRKTAPMSRLPISRSMRRSRLLRRRLRAIITPITAIRSTVRDRIISARAMASHRGLSDTAI